MPAKVTRWDEVTPRFVLLELAADGSVARVVLEYMLGDVADESEEKIKRYVSTAVPDLVNASGLLTTLKLAAERAEGL